MSTQMQVDIKQNLAHGVVPTVESTLTVIPRLGLEKSVLRAFCWPRGLGTVARGT